ncbi:uncharacterized protein TNCV_1845301 [Trichonephila clavipes]|nr:uncharacterized protein TNCV_1845301 [Trichonephila clavipes]
MTKNDVENDAGGCLKSADYPPVRIICWLFTVKAQLPGGGKVVDASARFLGALVASTWSSLSSKFWSTKITDSEDSDAENELSDTLPENILELFNSDTDESDFEGFH